MGVVVVSVDCHMDMNLTVLFAVSCGDTGIYRWMSCGD